MKCKETLAQKTGWFLGFAGPAMLCFTAVIIVPFIYGLYLTLTDWNGISSTKELVGLRNYLLVFADSSFWRSLLLTLIYSAISVALINLVGFLLAYLVTNSGRCQNLFRLGFFTPNLIGGVVLGYIWQFIFSRALVYVGTSCQLPLFIKSWLSDPVQAVAALVAVSVWQYSGYMMLIYIAGLTGIPQELTEAARIDGCSKPQALLHVTMPLMTSSFVICIFLSITRCFMSYDLNMALTEGGPYGSTVMAAMYVYQKAFSNKQYGLGQTEAVILFAVCALIALLQVYAGKKKEMETT